MKQIITIRFALAALAGTLIFSQVSAAEAPSGNVLAPPSPEVVRERVMLWLDTPANRDPAKQQQIAGLWEFGEQRPDPAELFQRTITTFRACNADAAALVEACRFQPAPLLAPDAQLLDSEDQDTFFINNLRLYYGRYLAQRRMYEEGLSVLDRIELSDVADPATCLFFKAVCQHHLLMKDEGLKTIEQLTKRTEGVPARYNTVATLMQYDLEGLEDKSLDEISRKMLDVQRRLELGRSGQKVQKVEDEIIAGLDEIIKKIEEQMGGGGGGGAGQGGNSNESSNPADDSRVKGATAPGNVDPKKIKKGGEWGEMEDKLRSRVKQLIGRDFPAHYHRAVEEYFRNAAKRTAPTDKQ